MQNKLFQDSLDLDAFEDHILGDGASIREYPAAFSPDAAEQHLTSLLKTIPWRQESLRIAGRVVPVPRLQCWMGDRASRYGYSGIRLEPEPWNSTVAAIRSRVEALCQLKFNSVLLNYYRNGRDSVSWHADDEAELGPNPVIASVSLGAERSFHLRPKHEKSSEIYKIPLQSGSILVMGKDLQNKWIHQVPKVKGLEEPRINLTFRIIR